MAWKLISHEKKEYKTTGVKKIECKKLTQDDPYVSISGRFTFSFGLEKAANIHKNSFVSIYIDESNKKIGFEFKENSDKDSDFKIESSSHLYCDASDVVKLDWVIQTLHSEIKFRANKEDKLWVIQL